MSKIGQNNNWTEQFDNWMELVKAEFENALSNRLGKKASIEIDSSRTFDSEEFPELFSDETLVIECPFNVDSLGAWRFMMERSLAAGLMDLTSEEGADPDSNMKAIPTLWKNIMDAAAGSLSAMIGLDVEASLPGVALDSSQLIDEIDIYTGMKWDLQVDGAGGGTVLMFVPFDLSSVFEDLGDVPPIPEIKMPEIVAEPQPSQPKQEKPRKEMQPLVRPVEFEDLAPSDVGKHADTPRNIDMLLDVSLPITIELGRTKMLIKDVLALGAGSVIELDKLSGEPVDMFVNDKLFAKGEVVVIEENFGVRITELIKLDERLKALR